MPYAIPLLVMLGLGGPSETPTPTEPPPGPDQPAPAVVVLMVPDAADTAHDERLIDTIFAHTDGLPLELRVVRYAPDRFQRQRLIERSKRRAAEAASASVMWVELPEPDQTIVYLYQADSGRLFRRVVPTPRDAPAAAAETVANIASSALAQALEGPVQALEEVDPAQLAPPDPPPEPKKPIADPPPQRPPTPPPEKPPVSWPRLWLRVGYVGNTFADDLPWQHAVGLGAAWGPAPGAFVGVRYDFAIPAGVDDPRVDFELRSHPVWLLGGYRLGFAKRWDVEFSARVGIDPIRRLSDGGGTRVASTDPEIRVFSMAAVGLGIGVSFVRQVRLGLTVGAQALLSRANYVVENPTARVLTPHPARFFVEAGLHFGLLWRPKSARAR